MEIKCNKKHMEIEVIGWVDAVKSSSDLWPFPFAHITYDLWTIEGFLVWGYKSKMPLLMNGFADEENLSHFVSCDYIKAANCSLIFHYWE